MKQIGSLYTKILSSKPANPDTGFVKFYNKNNIFYFLFEDGTEVPLIDSINYVLKTNDQDIDGIKTFIAKSIFNAGIWINDVAEFKKVSTNAEIILSTWAELIIQGLTKMNVDLSDIWDDKDLVTVEYLNDIVWELSFISAAIDVSYDNTVSWLTAEDVQEAIDELQTKKVPIAWDVDITWSKKFDDTNSWKINSPLYTFAASTNYSKPMGWSWFVKVAGSTNTPPWITSQYFHYSMIGKRDSNGWYSALAKEYDSEKAWVCYGTTSSSSPVWKQVMWYSSGPNTPAVTGNGWNHFYNTSQNTIYFCTGTVWIALN